MSEFLREAKETIEGSPAIVPGIIFFLVVVVSIIFLIAINNSPLT